MAKSKRPADREKGLKKKRELSLNQRLIKAMANPLRVKILGCMNARPSPWSPRELQLELGEGLSNVSYHVKVLRDYELIELVKTEPARGATEHFYLPVERAFLPSELAKQIPAAAGHLAGKAILEDIDKDLAASLKLGKFFARPDWHTSWIPAHLDGQGCEAAEKLADRFVEGFLEIEAESAQRNADRRRNNQDAECIPVSAAALVFGSGEGKKTKSLAQRRAEEIRGKSA